MAAEGRESWPNSQIPDSAVLDPIGRDRTSSACLTGMSGASIKTFERRTALMFNVHGKQQRNRV